MSLDSSPPPSDDSALGSLTSSGNNCRSTTDTNTKEVPTIDLPMAGTSNNLAAAPPMSTANSFVVIPPGQSPSTPSKSTPQGSLFTSAPPLVNNVINHSSTTSTSADISCPRQANDTTGGTGNHGKSTSSISTTTSSSGTSSGTSSGASSDRVTSGGSASANVSNGPASDKSTPKSSEIPVVRSNRSRVTRVLPKDLRVNSVDLEVAAKQMRCSNVSLISSCVRIVMRCFDDLDIHRFEKTYDYLINFISNGINKCSQAVLRPMSIIWPEHYDTLVEQLSILDAFLLNSEFSENPINWMLERGLTTIPTCGQCKEKMNLHYDKNIARWQCKRTHACANYFIPVQRPTFFSNYENIGLDKLLFSIYYWATCIPGEDLYSRMNIEPHILNSIWRRIQNVCRTALEKSYPRHRLTNVIDHGPDQQSPAEPIDLVSIKLNNVYVVCAKHPCSNLVRLGLYIPNVSLYNFVDLTESWFAHGAHIRVCETKFKDLSLKRTDLKIDLVTRLEMISKNERFFRDSAFGYLVCQLSHVFKDFDSSTLSRESLKLVLAEMQWRELYGTTPYDAFTNIVNHMAQYGEASDWYSEPSLPVDGEETFETDPDNQLIQAIDSSQYIWTEKYFYASVDPIDSDGKVICRFIEPPKPEDSPCADVRIRCHECKFRYECFDFGFHIISHVEANRKQLKNTNKAMIECKHCFKTIKREDMFNHSTLFRCQYHTVKYGCRICCIKLENRSQYLQHMRRLHFEHETPYRCPSCRFCSSFQMDVFIHFQEEHRHSMIALCPLCLRSFTVSNPKQMTVEKMNELSRVIYNHISRHYILSKKFICTKCCLCFIDEDKLMKHSHKHHNPLEIRDLQYVKVEPFIVTKDEEKFCVKALQVELFIANKRPNKSLNKQPNNQIPGVQEQANLSQQDQSADESENGLIDVRGIMNADKFLAGGEANLKVSKSGGIALYNSGTPASKVDVSISCSSQKLIDYLSKMRRADGVIPNQSVILTPDGTPAKCCECLQFITVDHYVASIICRKCRYSTNCPRAATNHNMITHNKCGP